MHPNGKCNNPRPLPALRLPKTTFLPLEPPFPAPPPFRWRGSKGPPPHTYNFSPALVAPCKYGKPSIPTTISLQCQPNPIQPTPNSQYPLVFFLS